MYQQDPRPMDEVRQEAWGLGGGGRAERARPG